MHDAPLTELTAFAMEEAVRLTGSMIGYVAFVNEDESVLTMHAWSREALRECAVDDPPVVYPLETTGLWGEALRQRRPVITNDYAAPNPLKRGIPEGHVPITRHMNVPVFDGDRIVIAAGVGNKEAPYDETDVAQLTLLMEGMWRALQRRRAEEARERLEEQLAETQKLESIGQLAGGVAHDFNNMLTPILGYAEMILDSLPADHPHRPRARGIIGAAERARDLVRQLLAFARRQTLTMGPLDLNDVVDGLQPMLRRTIREDVAIETRLSPKLPAIDGDENQISQVVLNLVVNAQDAMPNGGIVTIGTSEAYLCQEHVHGTDEVASGPHVMLTVGDTGVGMDRETLERVFEPFLTTKKLAGGTGLGLSTVHGIVRQHGGHVWADSVPGSSTEFHVCFPPSSRARRVRTPAPGPKAQGGAETILVAEDARDVREMTCEMLRQDGYTVLEAANGEMALEIAAAHTGPLHLLLTDVIMPGMDGKGLHDRLSVVRRDLRVLYMSGYTASVIGRHGVLGTGTPFIHKPFSHNELTSKVRKVLDDSPA